MPWTALCTQPQDPAEFSLCALDTQSWKAFWQLPLEAEPNDADQPLNVLLAPSHGQLLKY
ncbi:hypothetical protein EYF80_047034 [Liparis tanakae]|uniref:Uncharacterized protein n=1 Tax=Liparis tanakae TaxID=230148 RepID=A0A4Z2FPE9_9TELE|nr:hypothetical protein EYF80_047034 [Liparis tanakae]